MRPGLLPFGKIKKASALELVSGCPGQGRPPQMDSVELWEETLLIAAPNVTEGGAGQGTTDPSNSKPRNHSEELALRRRSRNIATNIFCLYVHFNACTSVYISLKELFQ